MFLLVETKFQRPGARPNKDEKKLALSGIEIYIECLILP
jgi:hypothetical protein